jgi:hypothetical protein
MDTGVDNQMFQRKKERMVSSALEYTNKKKSKQWATLYSISDGLKHVSKYAHLEVEFWQPKHPG